MENPHQTGPLECLYWLSFLMLKGKSPDSASIFRYQKSKWAGNSASNRYRKCQKLNGCRGSASIQQSLMRVDILRQYPAPSPVMCNSGNSQFQFHSNSRPSPSIQFRFQFHPWIYTGWDPKILNLLFGLFCFGNAQDFAPLVWEIYSIFDTRIKET